MITSEDKNELLHDLAKESKLRSGNARKSEVRRTEIRSIHIDFDNNILEINGKPHKKKTIVNLPASDGWKFRKLFNGDESNAEEKSDCLNVEYSSCN